MMHWGGGFGMGFGWIFMILFWGLVILGVVYLVKHLASGTTYNDSSKETAEDVLRKRFAGGEISSEEFEEAMAVLRGKE